MLRGSFLCRLSSKIGSTGGGGHRPRNAQRMSKAALLQSRHRSQTQMGNFHLQQSLNADYGEQQRQLSRQTKALERAAYGLTNSKGRAAHNSNGSDRYRNNISCASHTYIRPQERADEMAAARHLLMLTEATRKEMKRGRGRRADTFRALKRR